MTKYGKPCPVCESTAKQCKRPSEHGAAEWHVEREDQMALDCMCAKICQPWLTRRGLVTA